MKSTDGLCQSCDARTCFWIGYLFFSSKRRLLSLYHIVKTCHTIVICLRKAAVCEYAHLPDNTNRQTNAAPFAWVISRIENSHTQRIVENEILTMLLVFLVFFFFYCSWSRIRIMCVRLHEFVAFSVFIHE